VVVRRTYDLPVGVDAQLRALAAARNLSVEQLLTDLAQHAA
jgi:predicted DNA-binding ribbon-helix-helix protein